MISCSTSSNNCLIYDCHTPNTVIVLSPDQTESQVDAYWKLGSTFDSVWPGLACTCVDLRWLALTLVEIKFARKSKQVFHRLAPNPSHAAQVEYPNEIEDSLPYFVFFCEPWNVRVRCATQLKSQRKFKLRPLATTWRSVWGGLYIQPSLLRMYVEVYETLSHCSKFFTTCVVLGRC